MGTDQVLLIESHLGALLRVSRGIRGQLKSIEEGVYGAMLLRISNINVARLHCPSFTQETD